MSTKRISELPLMEEVTENLNILVEDDGETKRIPVSSVGSGGNMSDDAVIATKETLLEVAAELTDFYEGETGYYSKISDEYTPEPFVMREEPITCVFDGKEYIVSPVYDQIGGVITNAFGNLSLKFEVGESTAKGNTVEDTGEPFLWMKYGGLIWLYARTDGAHTLSVIRKTIESRFLPETLKYIVDSANDIDSAGVYVPKVEVYINEETGKKNIYWYFESDSES